MTDVEEMKKRIAELEVEVVVLRENIKSLQDQIDIQRDRFRDLEKTVHKLMGIEDNEPMTEIEFLTKHVLPYEE